jgi:hypothetical protein
LRLSVQHPTFFSPALPRVQASVMQAGELRGGANCEAKGKAYLAMCILIIHVHTKAKVFLYDTATIASPNTLDLETRKREIS